MTERTSAGMRAAKPSAYVGLVCGVAYAFGGLVHDLSTTGLSVGTALAFLALVGMPLGFGLLGFLLGVLAREVSRLLPGAGP